MANYYVATATSSPPGNDSNPGTIGAPFLTINHGVAALSAGDTLYVRAGTYVGYVTNIGSGSAGNVKTVVGYFGDATPVLQSTTAGWPILYLGDQSYLIFKNLIFDGTGLPMDQFAIFLDGASHHVTVQNSEIKNVPKSGIYVGPSSHDNTFDYPTVHNNGSSNQDHGIYLNGYSNIVDHGTIYGNYGFGVQTWDAAGASHDNIIRNNKIYNNAISTGQAGIVLAGGANNTAYNNIIWGSPRAIMVGDTTTTNNTVYNNTCYKSTATDYGILVAAAANGTIIKNNIIFGFATPIQNNGTNTTSSNNLTASDPLFVDAPNADFHLQAGSPAIDAGTTIGTITTDIAGVSRQQGSAYDIGAYEYAGMVSDRVKETSTTTGTGSISLAGAVSKFQTFVSAIGSGATCYYAIIHQSAAEWEVGIGTVTAGSPDTLSRTTILASSNSGTPVNFSNGTKDVFVTIPAARVAMLGVTNIFTAKQVISTVSGAVPVTSAAFEVASTTGAFLPPRMTTTQRDALTAVDGMIIYNSTTGALNYRKAGTWTAI